MSLLFWYLLLFLHAGSLLWGDPRRRLARQGVHGPKKLVRNATSFSQSTQQSAVNSCRVVADCMFSRKKQARNGLGEQRTPLRLDRFLSVTAANTFCKSATSPPITPHQSPHFGVGVHKMVCIKNILTCPTNYHGNLYPHLSAHSMV